MIRIQNATKSFLYQVILENATWQINPGTISGLVGPNGTGKTTLLKIILEEESLDSGDIIRANRKSLTIGHLPQNVIDFEDHLKVLAFVLSGRKDLLDLEKKMKALEVQIDASHAPNLVHEQAEAHEAYERLGGYTFRSDAKQILVGMGFDTSAFEQILRTFSGGWRMRALLARILLRRPDFLLLDEPTNHLDSDSLSWLEHFLKNYDGAIVIVSHDRYFLNAVTNQIVELEFGKLNVYHTNYDGYRTQKAENRERLISQKSRQDKELQRIQRFIERFRYKSTKSKAVQSRVKMLEKIDKIEIPQDEEGPIQFSFPNPPRLPKIVAELKHISKRYDENIVYEDLNFTIYRGDKIALVGPNGGGKTTLLKLLANIEKKDRGTVHFGEKVKIAYFAQHAADALNPEHNVEEAVQDVAEFDDIPKIRNILGAFGFSGEDVKKKIRVLSGGEKNRVALAQMLFRKAGLLLLDEPTNHLDIPSRQVLEYALRVFEGAYIVVSHDRYFVNEVAKRIIHVDHELNDFDGDFEDYLQSLKNKAQTPKIVSESSRKRSRQAAAELRKKIAAATKKIRSRIEDIENAIEKTESLIADAELQFARAGFYDNADVAKEIMQSYKEAQQRNEDLLHEWEALNGELEHVEEELRNT